jgi:hypothetical protein
MLEYTIWKLELFCASSVFNSENVLPGILNKNKQPMLAKIGKNGIQPMGALSKNQNVDRELF